MQDRIINQDKRVADKLKRDFFIQYATGESSVVGVASLEFPPESSRYILQVFVSNDLLESLPDVFIDSDLNSISVRYEVSGDVKAS